MRKYRTILLDSLASSYPSILSYRLFSQLKKIALRFASKSKQAALYPHVKDLRLDVRTHIKYPENVTFGENVIVGGYCLIGAMAKVNIGDYVRISRGVTIETAGLEFPEIGPPRHCAKPINIGRGVWLGTGCTVLSGVSIGEQAIIGAGTIVTKDIGPRQVVVGAANRQFAKHKGGR